jgi:hypothetical protein
LLGAGVIGLSVVLPLAAGAKQPDPWTAFWFLLPCSIAGLCTVLGSYILLAIYTGWSLPRTAGERESAPDLHTQDIRLRHLRGNEYVLELGYINEGGGDVRDAMLNVLVPDFVSPFQRCLDDGTPIAEGGLAHTSESLMIDASGVPIESSYWNGPVTFPAHAARPLHFLVGLQQGRELRVLARLTSSAIPGRVHMADTLFRP